MTGPAHLLYVCKRMRLDRLTSSVSVQNHGSKIRRQELKFDTKSLVICISPCIRGVCSTKEPRLQPPEVGNGFWEKSRQTRREKRRFEEYYVKGGNEGSQNVLSAIHKCLPP